MDILQALQDQYTQNANIGAVITLGPEAGSQDIVPQITDGAQVLSQSITLANPAHRVLAKVTLWGRSSGTEIAAALFRGSDCIDAKKQTFHADDFSDVFAMTVLDLPGSVGPHTYSVRVGLSVFSEVASPGVLRLNGTQALRLFGGVSKCTLTLLEVG